MITLKMEEILNHFYEISGMDVAIINTNNVIIAAAIPRRSTALTFTNLRRVWISAPNRTDSIGK